MPSLPPLTLDADPFWTSFVEFNRPGAFEAAADRIAFRPEVPTEVVGHFEPVRQLVRLSYTSADLLDVAFERALFGFELALKHRHQELEHSEWSGPLARLIDWASARDLFEDGSEPAHALRAFRNRAAHPAPDQLVRLRYVALEALHGIPRFINGTYDDPALRAERRGERRTLNGVLRQVVSSGAVADLRSVGLSRHLTFLAEAVHLENRRPGHPTIYYTAVWPLFDPLGSPGGSTDLGEPVVIDAVGWEAAGAEVRLRIETGRPVILSPITAPAHAEHMRTWREGVRSAQGGDGLVKSLTAYRLSQLRTALREQYTPGPAES